MLVKYKRSFNIENIKEMEKSFIDSKDLFDLKVEFPSIPERYFLGSFFATLISNPNHQGASQLVFFKNSNRSKLENLIKDYASLMSEYNNAEEYELDIYQEQLDSIFSNIAKLSEYLSEITEKQINFLKSKNYSSVESYF